MTNIIDGLSAHPDYYSFFFVFSLLIQTAKKDLRGSGRQRQINGWPDAKWKCRSMIRVIHNIGLWLLRQRGKCQITRIQKNVSELIYLIWEFVFNQEKSSFQVESNWAWVTSSSTPCWSAKRPATVTGIQQLRVS